MEGKMCTHMSRITIQKGGVSISLKKSRRLRFQHPTLTHTPRLSSFLLPSSSTYIPSSKRYQSAHFSRPFALNYVAFSLELLKTGLWLGLLQVQALRPDRKQSFVSETHGSARYTKILSHTEPTYIHTACMHAIERNPLQFAAG
jgi:hypothetical protein